MIPHVPAQRKSKVTGNAFGALVKYITQDAVNISPGPQQQPGATRTPEFAHLLNYATAKFKVDGRGDKCIAVRTHGVIKLSSAALEMQAVANKNRRVQDPAYHIILSWPEHERPSVERIFDAAEHALRALNLHEHQYVLAVHDDTDNIHCHVSVSRVHPATFKSRNIEWATKTLHLEARQSELKHGWSHDNGIYVVEVDGHGQKTIVLNKDIAGAAIGAEPHVHRELGSEEILPTWHDPEGLDLWLKKTVARALKRDLPELNSWQALHAWLSRYDITLVDAGGGLRLHAVSAQSGGTLDLAASKGLRILIKKELVARWGEFAKAFSIPVQVTDFSDLTPGEIQRAIDYVIATSPDGGRPPQHIIDRNGSISRPDDQFIRSDEFAPHDAADRNSRMRNLPDGGVANDQPAGSDEFMVASPARLGDFPLKHGQDLIRVRPGADDLGSAAVPGTRRDNSRRSERKEERATARADLRDRYAQYKRVVRVGDAAHQQKLKSARQEHSDELKSIREQYKLARRTLSRDLPRQQRLIALSAIKAESISSGVQADVRFTAARQSLRATKPPALNWRTWLCEQSNLGDQAALSALRGIVYQGCRDAKKADPGELDQMSVAAETNEYRETQFRKSLARLLKEEQNETAIRSSNAEMMRPHEIDSLIMAHRDCQWRITGNGNAKYSTLDGKHLFTDRGNRLTFDRVIVSDEDILLALAHARQKFGVELILTGTSIDFQIRVATLADNLGMVVLNPELQEAVKIHRDSRRVQVSEAPPIIAPVEELAANKLHELPVHDVLRKNILAIDPGAKFVTPLPLIADSYHIGPVAASITGVGFAQHTGRNTYVLHGIDPPLHSPNNTVTERYRSVIAASIAVPRAGKVTVGDTAERYVRDVKRPVRQEAPVMVPAPSMSPESPAIRPMTVSAEEWIVAHSAATNKPIVSSVVEHDAVLYRVLHIADDGVVIDRGRSLTIYPRPAVVDFVVGNRVSVNGFGTVQASILSKEDNGQFRG